MPPRPYDVVVIGGGPAGLAASAALARQGKAVALFERRPGDGFRVGETLSPEVAGCLRELGAWDALSGHLQSEACFTTVRSAWGSYELLERPSIVHPLGSGWHVDRTRFDSALASWTESQGVHIHADAGTCTVERAGEGFVVRPRRGRTLLGHTLLDGSGRGAPATARFGDRRWMAQDRQVAILARLVPVGRVDPGPGLILEAAEEGFWYSAPMADGALIVVLVTDSDLLAALAPDRSARFQRAFARTGHTRTRAYGFETEGRPLVFRSDSGRLVPDRGPGWRAIGDASMATDPLGGDGVVRALRSALDAVADLEAPFEPGPAERRFGDYLDLRASYYALEGRWPRAPFWARRRPLDVDGSPLRWRDVPLTLGPDSVLAWAQDAPSGAEAWLPPEGLERLERELAVPQSAHALMTVLKKVAPLGDRRLLVGLQWLLASGVLREQ